MLEALESLARLEPGRARAVASVDHREVGGATDPRASRAMAMVSESFREAVRQTDVAEAVGLAPSAFSRMFRRVTGGTFTQYVQRLRVAEACRLLIDTDRSITAVGYASGFHNLSHFNRVFRELVGQTPRAYRRRHGG